jgi:hypothetical protein
MNFHDRPELDVVYGEDEAEARRRGWIRGDVLPETSGDLTIQDMIDINKVPLEPPPKVVHGTELGRFSTKNPNVCQAPATLTAMVPMPDPIAAEETKPFKLPGYGDRLFTFKTVDLTKLSEYERGRRRGAEDMLRMIRGSLQAYPNAGGDIEVMKEVDRIVRTTVKESMIALENAMLKTMRKIQEEVKEKV